MTTDVDFSIEPDVTEPTDSRDGLPSYAELFDRTDAPAGSSWGLFGDESDLGTVALLTPERVFAAAMLVRTGTVVRLDLPLDAFKVPLVPHRPKLVHSIISNGHNHRDDFVEQLFLQVGTQLDGLRHIRDETAGFYNGVADDEVSVDNDRLGIGGWAKHGIVGGGLLLDVDRYFRSVFGRACDHRAGEQLGPQVLDAVLQAQGSVLRPGSILMIRTGWLTWYRQELNPQERAALGADLRCAGLAQSEEMLAWLWDRRISVVACDNPAVEALPTDTRSPFVHANSGRDGLRAGMLHPALIARLGLALGELWDLDELATLSNADGRFDAMVVANPLYLPAAVGSPANAVAIR